MKVLVVKMSSLGDIVHTLPALTDASRAHPGIRFDWVVEEDFVQIPAWHPAVERVIPVALRRWRRHPLRDFRGPEWRATRAQLRSVRYDALIDAQGLVKSAFIARLIAAPRYGMDKKSVRERLASAVYHHPIAVPRDMHAVQRTRTLFARSLNYALPSQHADCDLGGRFPLRTEAEKPFLVFFHGSAVARKLWPETHWLALAQLAAANGLRVLLPWGSDAEHERARRIASLAGCADVEVLPRLDLSALAGLLCGATATVAVDTGLGHLAAALGVPGVSLYGHTHPDRVGTVGPAQLHLRDSAQLAAISVADVWAGLQSILDNPAGGDQAERRA